MALQEYLQNFLSNLSIVEKFAWLKKKPSQILLQCKPKYEQKLKSNRSLHNFIPSLHRSDPMLDPVFWVIYKTLEYMDSSIISRGLVGHYFSWCINRQGWRWSGLTWVGVQYNNKQSSIVTCKEYIGIFQSTSSSIPPKR